MLNDKSQLETENVAQQEVGGDCASRLVVPSSMRDVRIHEQWKNGFYGMFYGESAAYQIALERDHPESQWGWIVRTNQGAMVASGTEPKGRTLRDVLNAAGAGANLWHNIKVTHD